jgi:molybdopterin biosynthesis enzyme
MLAKLSGRTESELTATAALTRKVASAVGLAQVVPVRRDGDGAEPLTAKYLSFAALARANGWFLIPAESEGYQAGSNVAVRAWP